MGDTPLDPLDQDWQQVATRDSWDVLAVYQYGARELVARELLRLAVEMQRRPVDAEDIQARVDQLRSDVWCNCQAISGTVHYPGPWHERGGAPHYPCARKETVDG